jgi:hypothetical protein
MGAKLKHRVLVCGGRKFGKVDLDVIPDELEAALANAVVEQEFLKASLDNLKGSLEIDCVIHGGAKGADTLAGQWANNNDLPTEVYLPDWKAHPRTAGFIRNQRMLDEGKPTLVIAFPGGNGTKDMVSRAKKAGIPVYEVVYEMAR